MSEQRDVTALPSPEHEAGQNLFPLKHSTKDRAFVMDDNVTQRSGTALLFDEGDRCSECGYWYWERPKGEEGWHSLVPVTFADTPELANEIEWCGRCDVPACAHGIREGEWCPWCPGGGV